MTLYNLQNKESETRLMGIDYGSKRVGIALSDPGKQFALPHSVLENDETLFNKIEKICTDNGVKEIVLGESRNYRNEANAVLADSIDFKETLENKGYIVYFEPEFMTSIQASRIQGENKMLDASAAAVILQSFLDKNNQ